MTRDTYVKTVAAAIGTVVTAFGLDASSDVVQAVGVILTTAAVFFFPK